MGPKVKLICVSNVFSRLMHFEKAGDIEEPHDHVYDHGTLLSSGSVQVDIVNDSGVTTSKTFKAPEFIFIEKQKLHKITALEDNTVCACIHAMRTNDGELLDPDFLIEPLHREGLDGKIYNDLVQEKYNKPLEFLTNTKPNR